MLMLRPPLVFVLRIVELVSTICLSELDLSTLSRNKRLSKLDFLSVSLSTHLNFLTWWMRKVFWNTLWCCRCVTPYLPQQRRVWELTRCPFFASSWYLLIHFTNRKYVCWFWPLGVFEFCSANEQQTFCIWCSALMGFPLMLSCPILFSDCCPLYSSRTHLNTSHNEMAEISTLCGPTVQWNQTVWCL